MVHGAAGLADSGSPVVATIGRHGPAVVVSFPLSPDAVARFDDRAVAGYAKMLAVCGCFAVTWVGIWVATLVANGVVTGVGSCVGR